MIRTKIPRLRFSLRLEAALGMTDEKCHVTSCAYPKPGMLREMGLRNGYVVTQLNDQEITGPDQAAEFFKTLAEGGEVSIQVSRSRGTRRRPRQINLDIQ